MNTINIAGIDELGLLKKRLVNKFSKDKNGKTCHFTSCNANIEFLLNDNDVQYNINVSNPPVKTFVSYFCGADVLFFEVHPDPDNALCDGPNMLFLKDAEDVFAKCKKIFEIVR